jgi:hypothetical protein
MLEIRIGYSLGGYRNNLYFFSSCLLMSRAYNEKLIASSVCIPFPVSIDDICFSVDAIYNHYDIMLCMKCSVGNLKIFFKNLKNISMLSKSYSYMNNSS